MWPFRKKQATVEEVKEEKTVPVLYEMFGGWGDRIDWQEIGERTVHGWKQKRPVVGDLVKAPMASGKDGLFRFIEVTYMTDPPDMFFGKLEGIGYIDDFKGEYTPEAERKDRVTFLR